MKNKLMILSICMLSTSLYAQTNYVGKVKGTEAACELEIVQTYFENNIETPENFRAEITVIMDNGHDLAAGEKLAFTLKPSPRPLIFSGVGENQKDQLNLLVASGSTGLTSPTAFSLKWLHGSHYHTGQCLNLVKVENN